MTKNSSSPRNQVRIIGGVWRGRKIHFPDAKGLRPTGDRIRETLFNWLAPDIREARCLDLFAGSGALSFEALSRGASLSLMLERDRSVALALQSSCDLLHASGAEIHQADAIQFLSQTPAVAPFDLVFVDPPFELNLWGQVFAWLEAMPWLSQNAIIYVESPRDLVLEVPSNWRRHRAKQAGQVNYQLFYRNENAGTPSNDQKNN